jgi:hypothetical protein
MRRSIALCVLVAFRPGWAADLETAKREWLSGDWVAAFSEAMPLAKYNDPLAQLIVADCLLKGPPPLKNEKEALKWFLEASREDNLQWKVTPKQAGMISLTGFRGYASFWIGNIYLRGLGVRRDANEAIRWYLNAAELEFAEAETVLGYMYWTGQYGAPRDYAEAFKWANKSAQQGEPGAWLLLGGIYSEGKGARQDYVQAYAWTALAAQKDLPGASDSLSYLAQRMTLEQILYGELFVRDHDATRADKVSSSESEIPGVSVSGFRWEQGCYDKHGEFSFSMHNSSSNDPLTHAQVVVVFLGRDQAPFDFQHVDFQGPIPAGLTKRVTGSVGERTKWLACEGFNSALDSAYERKIANDKRTPKQRKATAMEDFKRKWTEKLDAGRGAELATRFTSVRLKVTQ